MEPNYVELEIMLKNARKACETNADCVRENLRKISEAKTKRRLKEHSCGEDCRCKAVKEVAPVEEIKNEVKGS